MLEIGSVIDGKYKILNVIGKGGMSTVYLAMNERVNKQWAVKEIHKNNYQNFEMDKKEIELMKKLKHPHLPSIVDVIERDNSLLIVMDYIEGRSLESVLAENKYFRTEQVLVWAEQLCDVLQYLHSQCPPIIYRDMKPGNVMQKPDGNLVLIDFGAAREYKPENLKDTISLGTRGYAAPEQYRADGQSDARTDIYCLGVMLFQLLTGESPHELRPIRQIRPELSAGLEAVIIKCTKIKKEERYQSARELAYALKHYWEYDQKYQKQQKKRFACFVISLLTCICCVAGMLLFGILEQRAKNHTYESYLLRARSAVTKEEEVENYQKAISIRPGMEDGYLELLEKCFLDDQILTAAESEQLRFLLNSYGNEKETNLTALQKNREGYEKFAYEVAIAYFYKFEEKSNKKNAQIFSEIAAQSETLDIQKKERAKRLAKVSDYYYRMGVVDEAGDTYVTYREYWDDLVALSEGNLVELDNERTAMMVYEELAAQVISNVDAFFRAGVTEEEIIDQLKNTEEHLKTDFTEQKNETLELLQYVKQAIRVASSAYSRAEEVQ